MVPSLAAVVQPDTEEVCWAATERKFIFTSRFFVLKSQKLEKKLLRYHNPSFLLFGNDQKSSRKIERSLFFKLHHVLLLLLFLLWVERH